MKSVLIILIFCYNFITAQPLFELSHSSKSMHYSDIIKYGDFYYVLGETRYINSDGPSIPIEGTFTSGYFLAKLDIDFKVKATSYFNYTPPFDYFLFSHDFNFFRFTDSTITVTYNKSLGSLPCAFNPISLGMNWCCVPYYSTYKIEDVSFLGTAPIAPNDFACEQERIPKTILAGDTTYYLAVNANKDGLDKLRFDLVKASTNFKDTILTTETLQYAWEKLHIIKTDDTCFAFAQRDSLQNSIRIYRLDKTGELIDSINFPTDSLGAYNLFYYKFDYPFYFNATSVQASDGSWDSRAVYFESNTLHSLYFDNLYILDWKVYQGNIYALGVRNEIDDLDEIANNSNTLEVIKINPLNNSTQKQLLTVPNYQNAVLKVIDGKLILIREENIGEYETTWHSKLVFEVVKMSFENVTSNESLLLYPNPAATQLTLYWDGTEPARISIYNTLGQLVLTQAITYANTSFDISRLASGIYTLQLIDAKGRSAVRKWVKE